MKPVVLAQLAVLTACASAHAMSAERAERIRQAEVVVVSGSADHMEQVLRRAHVKFELVSPEELPALALHGQQVLMVNCTGEMSAAARERVRRFVTAGGFLYTTDHAVHYLVEKIFPGYIRWNGATTEEEIFPMRLLDYGDRGLLRHLGAGGQPRWQLAGGGYPFVVVDRQRVEVLMTSAEVGRRYHAPVLGVHFRVGDGQVIHVTGHFFTQPGQRPEVAAAGQSFEQLSANVVAEKRADRARVDGLYNVVAKRPVVLRQSAAVSSPPVRAASGGRGVETSAKTKLRILGSDGKMAHVRDAEGNEGWIEADAL
jgi:hypothetical protein